jgi:hypothetical protein
MVRFLAFALGTLIFALPAVAIAQTTATSGSSSGGTTASVTDGDPAMGSSGGATTPADPSGTADSTTAGGDVPMSGDLPLAPAAQEPEPEPDPEGPGQEQPGEPGGEAQPPTGDDSVEAVGQEAPAAGGGLPSTGLEILKLGLLGLVLVLEGARVRAIARRRRSQAKLAADGLPDGTPTASAVPVPEPDLEQDEQDDHDETREHAHAEQARSGRDEWSFPDPSEPGPTGLLPSTAMAKRRAREREGDRVN